MIAQAQSGTGKTACFAIGGLSCVDLTSNEMQVLVISPTRELAIQSGKVISSLGNFLKGLKVQSCYEVDKNFASFHQESSHILCGCPGKIIDILRKTRSSTCSIKMIVLDEADELLSGLFLDQIYEIFQFLKKDVQILLFSATVPDHIIPIVNNILHDPIRIIVKSEQLTLEGISQYYIGLTDDKMKYETLKDLFSYLTITQCIIYCNSINRVKELANAMKSDDFPVCCIHSNMDKLERVQAFNEFKSGKSRVLISSNVTARGIDIQQVRIVINFDLPKDVSTYLHRIGRSGRWGRKGVGINLLTYRDMRHMREIESYYSCQIQELPADLTFMKNL